MRIVGVAVGAESSTFMGLAGLGDLVLTCSDNQSRNRRLGLALGQGKSIDQAIADIGQVVEGASNARQVIALAKKHNVDMPIVSEVNRLLNNETTAEQAAKLLLSRESKTEV